MSSSPYAFHSARIRPFRRGVAALSSVLLTVAVAPGAVAQSQPTDVGPAEPQLAAPPGDVSAPSVPPSPPAPAPATEVAAVPAEPEREGSAERDAKAEANEKDGPFPRYELSARLQTGLERRVSFSSSSLDSKQPFFLDQARLGLKIELNPDLEAAFDAELTAEPVIRDAYVNVKIKRYLQVRAGHFKRPISRTELQGIGTLPFRERGLSSEFLRDANWAGRSLGVMAWGKVRNPKLRWSFAAMNSGDTIDVDEAARLRGIDLLARVEFEALSWLEIAVDGGHKFTEVNAEGPNENLSAVGADALLQFGALRCVLEARLAQNPQPPTPPSNVGRTPFALSLLGYATYDIAFTKKFALQPVVVLEHLDTDRNLSEDETLRAVAGLNLLFWHSTLRLLPQVEVIRPIGDTSARSQGTQTTYYLLLSLQL